MNFSVIIPVFNEQECIPILLEEIMETTDGLPLEEVVVVDDGSDDATVEKVNECRKKWPKIRLIHHKERRGQSTGLRTGISSAKAPLVVTMDGDGQNNPADIKFLYEKYMETAEASPRTLVAGQREKRHDNLIRILSSRIANGVRAFMLNDGVRDTGCSLKLFRRDDFLFLPFFNHIHRFIPAMMKANDVNIVLVDVSHRPRERGVSKYGLFDRLWVGIADLFGVRWLVARLCKHVDTVEEK